jgi:tetratricopeptide (TPR) repeat protein
MKIFQRITWLEWLLLGVILLILSGFAGLSSGYILSVIERERNLANSIAVDTQIQFDLGKQDFEVGNYDLARQRFEYVLQQDPGFPGAVNMLSETLVLLSTPAVQISDIPLPSSSASPTPDTRPVEELFTLAQDQFRNQEWKNLVQTIVSLRDIDPLYRAGEVDRMLFLGLRFSGIEKILNDGNLEGGVYDLALAERFAPLDSQARIYQEWARLYQIGVSFWSVIPEKSVYYFSQLALAAPYLRDLSGIYAQDRYRMALLQYADQLAQAAEWCLADEQYQLAYSMLEDQRLQPTLTFVEEQCSFGGISPSPTPEAEIIVTPTMSFTLTSTPTQELILTPTAELTLTPSPEPEISITPTMIITPTLVVTQDPLLTPPVEATLTPTPIEAAPEPAPTETDPAIAPTPTPTTESTQ